MATIKSDRQSSPSCVRLAFACVRYLQTKASVLPQHSSKATDFRQCRLAEDANMQRRYERTSAMTTSISFRSSDSLWRFWPQCCRFNMYCPRGGLVRFAGVRTERSLRPRYRRYRVVNKAKINVGLIGIFKIEVVLVTALIIVGRTKALATSTSPLPNPYIT